MAYTSGMMNKRVVVAKRAADTATNFGKNGQMRYSILGEFWAAEDFIAGHEMAVGLVVFVTLMDAVCGIKLLM